MPNTEESNSKTKNRQWLRGAGSTGSCSLMGTECLFLKTKLSGDWLHNTENIRNIPESYIEKW